MIYRLDLVKVMSDFPYQKGGGANWWELKPLGSPFPAQIEALKLIQDGIKDTKYSVETIFNPYNVAEKLSSKEEVKHMMTERPQALLDALEAIGKSEAAHAKRRWNGAKGIFLAIANAQDSVMTREQYDKFSAPFDRMVLDAAAGAPLNTLHLHGKGVWLDRFWKGWGNPVINYSVVETGVPLAEARRQYAGVLMGGLDETKARTARLADYQKMIQAAKAVGPKWSARRAARCGRHRDAKLVQESRGLPQALKRKYGQKKPRLEVRNQAGLLILSPEAGIRNSRYGEVLGLVACASNQRAIDVGLSHQTLHVVRFDDHRTGSGQVRGVLTNLARPDADDLWASRRFQRGTWPCRSPNGFVGDPI